MQYAWDVNIYDEDGDVEDVCVLVHAGHVILRFENTAELRLWANKILESIPKIKKRYPNA